VFLLLSKVHARFVVFLYIVVASCCYSFPTVRSLF
jgi:hypothetical protein